MIGTAFAARFLSLAIAFLASGVHLNSSGAIFLVNSVRGFAILAKSLIHHLTTPMVPRNPCTLVGFLQEGQFLSLAVTSWDMCILSIDTIAPSMARHGVASTILDPEMVVPLSRILVSISCRFK